MRKLWYMLLIGRPINTFLTLVSVATAGLLLRDVPPFDDLITAALGAALICGFGNAINDSLDHVTDRINKPERPIPSGRLSVTQGYISAVVHLAAGLALASLVNATCLLIAAFASLLLLGYALFGKRLLIVANTCVAGVSSLSFVYAAAVGENWEWSQIRLVVLGAAFVFLFHLGREIVKDMEDLAGDMASGARTLPVVFGVSASTAAAAVIFVLLMIAMLLAYVVFGLSTWYLACSVVLVVFPLIDILRQLARSSGERELHRVQAMLKALMPFGLAVLLIARYAI
jgi:geranylgeranylglycerol-phosphate geranylgeranyltransferase